MSIETIDYYDIVTYCNYVQFVGHNPACFPLQTSQAVSDEISEVGERSDASIRHAFDRADRKARNDLELIRRSGVNDVASSRAHDTHFPWIRRADNNRDCWGFLVVTDEATNPVTTVRNV